MSFFLVFDTSSLIRLVRNSEKLDDLRRRFPNFQIVIPESVKGEIRDFASKHFLEAFGDLIAVVKPNPKYIKIVIKRAKNFGGKTILSDVDLDVLAVALEFSDRFGKRVVLFSEDYDIQNLAETMGISFDSIQNKKINRVLKFFKKCLICGKVYDAESESCPDCGSKKFRFVVKNVKKP